MQQQQQQQIQGQLRDFHLQTDTAQSRSSYLTPFSKKQHSFLLTLSLIQDAKAQRWKEGEKARCLEGVAALIARVRTCHDPTLASPILEATWGAQTSLRAESMTACPD